LFSADRKDWPIFSTSGLVFSSLAGVAGAVGALCVVFASKAAVDAAKASELSPATFRVFIAPLIFGLAPIINVVVSSVWHPKPGEPMHFALDLPGWKLWVGIVLVGLGAALVLFSKEEAEASHGKKVASVQPAAVAAVPTPSETAR